MDGSFIYWIKWDSPAVRINFNLIVFFSSSSATVHITVVDVNEYAPTFLEPSYVKQVDEGRLYDLIIRVEATDRDCTAKFGDICKYEILTTDQPFTIDNDGKYENEL
jgi:hypothetical protein